MFYKGFRCGMMISQCDASFLKKHTQMLINTHALKGTMSSQAHARVDEKHFEIVGPTFTNTVGEFREL